MTKTVIGIGKIYRNGQSEVVTIPRSVCRNQNFCNGDQLIIKTDGKDKIIFEHLRLEEKTEEMATKPSTVRAISRRQQVTDINNSITQEAL